MKTNEFKKGTRVLLRNGWYATIMDNKKGNIRMAEVEGFYTEVGSIYAHDILRAAVGGRWVPVDLTPDQIKMKQMLA